MNVQNNGYDPSKWLKDYKAGKGKGEASKEPQFKPSDKTDTYTPSSPSLNTDTTVNGSTASQFGSTADYSNYLKETYPSITSSNISISDNALQQAMNDPEKEKALTDFLKGIEGSDAMRSEQIDGLTDENHTYKMTGYSIQIDNIADDGSGVEGTEFIEITVGRNDGKRINKEEFKDCEKKVDDLFDQLRADKEQREKELHSFLDKNIQIQKENDKRLEKNKTKEAEAEKIEAKREAAKELEELKKSGKGNEELINGLLDKLDTQAGPRQPMSFRA